MEKYLYFIVVLGAIVLLASFIVTIVISDTRLVEQVKAENEKWFNACKADGFTEFQCLEKRRSK